MRSLWYYYFPTFVYRHIAVIGTGAAVSTVVVKHVKILRIFLRRNKHVRHVMIGIVGVAVVAVMMITAWPVMAVMVIVIMIAFLVVEGWWG